MTAGIPDVLADPVGVIVAMVGGVEPALDRAVIEETVISVAGGRAKRRKLAQALAQRPAILTDARAAGRRGPAGRAAEGGRARHLRSRLRPGRPISSYRLAERLREHGIYSGQARSTALFQLATDLPATVLARLLGIHITVAAAWQRASAGDWTAYAAEISKRHQRKET
jgi:hypothetical protein